MQPKLRTITALLVALLPFGSLRKIMYRRVFGYRIAKSASIGWRTVISVDAFEALDGVRIGPYNWFRGPIKVLLGKNSVIHRHNRVTCTWSMGDERFEARGYKRELVLGTSALIVDRHLLDVAGRILIADDACLAGEGTVIYTHGLSVTDRDVAIGTGTYIGAQCRIAPGVEIGRQNVVALGSVVLTKIPQAGHLIAGNPARLLWPISVDTEAGRYKRTIDEW